MKHFLGGYIPFIIQYYQVLQITVSHFIHEDNFLL